MPWCHEVECPKLIHGYSFSQKIKIKIQGEAGMAESQNIEWKES